MHDVQKPPPRSTYGTRSGTGWQRAITRGILQQANPASMRVLSPPAAHVVAVLSWGVPCESGHGGRTPPSPLCWSRVCTKTLQATVLGKGSHQNPQLFQGHAGSCTALAWPERPPCSKWGMATQQRPSPCRGHGSRYSCGTRSRMYGIMGHWQDAWHVQPHVNAEAASTACMARAAHCIIGGRGTCSRM